MTISTTGASTTPFPLIHIAGEPRDRGFQYGVAARAHIACALDVYRHRLPTALGTTWDRVTALGRRFVPILDRYDPEILAEIEGIARGSKQPLDAIVTLNVRTELLSGISSGCTTLAVTPPASIDGHTYVAGNWDYYPELSAACILLAVTQPGKPNLLMFVEAGMVAKMGMNATGLGVCQNGLSLGSSRLGVPYYAALRRVINATSLREALGEVQGADRAFSANFMLAHADGAAADIEAAPTDCDVLRPIEGMLSHANHCLAPRLKPLDAGPRVLPDSLVRADLASRRLNALHGRIDMTTLGTLLRDHDNWPDAICRHVNPRQVPPDRMVTITSVVMDLTDRVMYLTNGPPCENEYEAIALDAAMGTPSVTT